MLTSAQSPRAFKFLFFQLISLLSVPFFTALAYAALGWLSLKASIPPDYVSLVFLPAGLALGVSMVYGLRALPGILIGSLTIQYMASQQAGVSGWSWLFVVSPLLATAQAWAGALLARHWARCYPGALDTPSKVLVLLLLIGPVSCLINASISVPVLWASGVIPTGGVLFSWWAWWLGDAIGTVLCLPLVLVFFGQPAAQWRTRRLTVGLPLLVAMVMVGVGFFLVKAWEGQRQSERLSRVTHEMAGKMQRRLDAQSDSVLTVSRMMQMPGSLEQHEFAASVEPWLRRYTGTQNFGWSLRVDDQNRAKYEKRYHTIKGRSSDGKTYPANRNPDYLPITLIEPLSDNLAALGLDITVLPSTAETVAVTRSTGQPSVSEGFRLVQETSDQRSVVMYQAVYETQSPAKVKGIVSAVLRMDSILEAVLGKLNPDELQLCLVDRSAAVSNRHLSGPAACELNEWTDKHASGQLPLYFGGRTWELKVRAEEGFLNDMHEWSAWALLGLSLLCVVILSAFLLVITGQAHRTQALVDLRTAELAQLAHYDSLTGLLNRSHWMTCAQAALQGAHRHGHAMAVIFLDLDHFKRINDTLGHTFGDELLQEVSQRLLPCLRREDLLARIGGDEFVALLPRLRRMDDAVAVAEKLLAALNMPLQVQSNEVSLSASMGIACFPNDGDTLDTLVKHADTAMYAAKEAGRNGYRFFEAEMNASVSRRMFIENNLRWALEREELFIVYQPQIDARSMQVVGVEALLRWRHPVEGLIPPDIFIPVAEDSGLIESLGAWVLASSCQQLKEWTETGLTQLTMAVNISALQFRKPGFVASVREAIQLSGIDPRRIELEITETLLMHPLQELDDRLDELAAMGMSFSLDDFGTGYSSLGYIKRLPISRIKLDKSFVTDLPGNSEDEAVARATLSIAKDLGMKTVAEGVETTTQRDYLVSSGCDYLQGYLFARPMQAEDLRQWMATYTTQLTGATEPTEPMAA
ncbi:MAG: EAL domain-containing protein [Betaproteobacteria bacterium]|nr:EAL domain-containing protein [Betaproteobacteria bacterium]